MIFGATALLASAAAAAAGVAPAPGLAVAEHSLDGDRHCAPFRWEKGDNGEPRAAISLMVAIAGKPFRFQLDTGADYTLLYGAQADALHWIKPGVRSFRPARFDVAGTTLERPVVVAMRETPVDGDIAGTLGLSSLVGRIAVLDYPKQRLCLFDEPDLPGAVIKAASFSEASLHYRKLFISVSSGEFRSANVIFDTGSSLMPFYVDLPLWRTLTGRKNIEGAPSKITGMAWGKPIVISGAPLLAPLTIGKSELGRQSVFVVDADPDGFSKWETKVDGIVGNAALWDGMVVLDLTVDMQFGIVR